MPAVEATVETPVKVSGKPAGPWEVWDAALAAVDKLGADRSIVFWQEPVVGPKDTVREQVLTKLKKRGTMLNMTFASAKTPDGTAFRFYVTKHSKPLAKGRGVR